MRLVLHSCILFSPSLITKAALPPGYEDEIYCPSGYCLRQKSNVPPGWTGPATSFVECASIVDPTLPPKSPSAWGARLPQENKDKLLAEGYHKNECSASESAADGAQHEEKPDENSADETLGLPAPGDSEQVWWQNPKVLAGLAIALVVMYFSRGAGAGASGGALPTGQSRAAMEEARKRHLDRLEQETEEIKGTDEWKEKEKRAKEEVECRVKPEDRKATTTRPGSGGYQSTVISSRGPGPDRMRPGRGGGGG